MSNKQDNGKGHPKCFCRQTSASWISHLQARSIILEDYIGKSQSQVRLTETAQAQTPGGDWTQGMGNNLDDRNP